MEKIHWAFERLSQEDTGRSNAKKKNAEEHSNALAYSSKHARLENLIFNWAFERWLEEGSESSNAKRKSSKKIVKTVRTPRKAKNQEFER